MDSIDELEIEYKRLQRHVNFLRKRYSTHVARDLAASLRNWVQLESVIDDVILRENWNVKFTKETLPKSLKKIRSGVDNFAVPLPGSVSTPNIAIAGAFVSNQKISQEDMKAMYQASLKAKPTPQKISFTSWLDASAYQIRINTEYKDVSREVFIDRAANLLGGTHPISNFVEDEHSTWADRYIVDSLKTIVGAWPLPYAILMESGEELLKAFKPFLVQSR